MDDSIKILDLEQRLTKLETEKKINELNQKIENLSTNQTNNGNLAQNNSIEKQNNVVNNNEPYYNTYDTQTNNFVNKILSQGYIDGKLELKYLTKIYQKNIKTNYWILLRTIGLETLNVISLIWSVLMLFLLLFSVTSFSNNSSITAIDNAFSNYGIVIYTITVICALYLLGYNNWKIWQYHHLKKEIKDYKKRNKLINCKFHDYFSASLNYLVYLGNLLLSIYLLVLMSFSLYHITTNDYNLNAFSAFLDATFTFNFYYFMHDNFNALNDILVSHTNPFNIVIETSFALIGLTLINIVINNLKVWQYYHINQTLIYYFN